MTRYPLNSEMDISPRRTASERASNSPRMLMSYHRGSVLVRTSTRRLTMARLLRWIQDSVKFQAPIDPSIALWTWRHESSDLAAHRLGHMYCIRHGRHPIERNRGSSGCFSALTLEESYQAFPLHNPVTYSKQRGRME